MRYHKTLCSVRQRVQSAIVRALSLQEEKQEAQPILFHGTVRYAEWVWGELERFPKYQIDSLIRNITCTYDAGYPNERPTLTANGYACTRGASIIDHCPMISRSNAGSRLGETAVWN
jgi:hypothetical protein